MIPCDQCGNWFHGNCVGINEDVPGSMEKENIAFVCPECKKRGKYLKTASYSVYLVMMRLHFTGWY